MFIYTTKNINEMRQTLIKFKEEHQEALGYDMKILNEHLKYDVPGKNLFDAFLMQVYEEAGLVKPECSIYRQMSNIINQNFNLKREVVEIGSGVFPTLGHYLSERQLKVGKGTVTVYDARVWTDYPTRAKLVKEYFHTSTKISANSLLVGLFPCEATQTIIQKAKQEDLEFCIALCGCNHSDNPYITTLEYHKLLIEQLKDELSARKKLKIKYFPNSCFEKGQSSLPILVVKNKPKVKIFTLK